MLFFLLLEFLLDERRWEATRIYLSREEKRLELSHEWPNCFTHETCHVDLHALRTEWIIDGRSTVFQLRMCILRDDFIFHTHKLWNALLHPVLDDVNLYLNI